MLPDSVDDPVVLGDFNPFLLQLRLHFDPSHLEQEASPTRYERVFFHEFTHLLQAIGSTFNIGTQLEVMDCIAQTLQEMGGEPDLVLHGLSNIGHARESLLEHFHGYHRVTLDGNYPSRPVELPPTKAKDLGLLYLNDEMYYIEHKERIDTLVDRLVGGVLQRADAESSPVVAIDLSRVAPAELFARGDRPDWLVDYLVELADHGVEVTTSQDTAVWIDTQEGALTGLPHSDFSGGGGSRGAK
jgi:hypothetical protein